MLHAQCGVKPAPFRMLSQVFDTSRNVTQLPLRFMFLYVDNKSMYA